MGAELEILYKLQSLDAKLLERQREVDQYDARLNERRAAMEKILARVEKLKTDRKEFVSQRAFAERRVADRQDQIKDRKQRVGRLKTERESRANQDEIRTMEQEIDGDETELLTMMEQVESVERNISLLEKEYNDFKDADHLQVEEEAERVEALRRELAEERKERDAVAVELRPAIVKRYETLLVRRQGRAVVEVDVSRGTCGGCHMHVPPQALIEIAREKKIDFCPNCQRFLYVVHPDQQEKQSPAADAAD